MGRRALNLLSLGAGVQSTALPLMACDGTLPGLDGAIFADTGWEPSSVYENLGRITGEFFKAGIPIYIVEKGDIRADGLDESKRFVSIPYFIRNADGSEGMGSRQCTNQYKLQPIGRKVRELLGAKAPDFRTVPKGNTASLWIGFSTDEIHRVNNKRNNRYTHKRYPLIELGMSRKDCERFLTSRGWTKTGKSACIGCPFHGNREWREMRDSDPHAWADAVDFDRRIRNASKRGQQFLHRSLLPLDIAPIDRVTRREWADRQLEIGDALAEMGDLDGCSPYGCRSGEAV